MPFAVLVAIVLCCSCAEFRAERALERSLERADSISADDLRAELAEIDRRWPRTSAAKRARRELEWLADLRHVAVHGPALLAWDAVRDLANAVERHRLREGRYPNSADELVPRYLERLPTDPWGNAVMYERFSGGYRVVCYGEDGIPGGSGPSSDLLVRNGREVHVGS